MIEWKEKFKESSVGGFTIHISPPQIQCLIQVFIRETAKCWDTTDLRTFVTSANSLIRKGLIVHEEKNLPNSRKMQIWYVTDAGKLLLQMLEIAGIINKKMIDEAIAKAKALNFKL